MWEIFRGFLTVLLVIIVGSARICAETLSFKKEGRKQKGTHFACHRPHI